jgi:GT2 family glycosyltransferase
MNLSLIICTYKRCESIKQLIKSISECATIPDSVIIVDGSPDDITRDYFISLKSINFKIEYYKVEPEDRGLTKQRNFGISRLPVDSEIVAFLDDDIVVEKDYFEKILETYLIYPDAIGVGGIDLKENEYFQVKEGIKYGTFRYYELDGWVTKEPLRYKARKIFGLMTDLQPGLIPEYSNGRSSLPPSGKIYNVEHFMGGIATYRKWLFDKVSFSTYFEGYGLYEDFDFCVRALNYGKLYVNTNAKVWHYHESSGRPDSFKYGVMVVRNGWYVWRLKFPIPSIKAKTQWHLIVFLLIALRIVNSICGPDRINALKEYLGRIYGWFSLWFNKPKIII